MCSAQLIHGFQGEETACIWMQSGVVSKKICNHGYECITCRFDRALGRVAHENAKARQEGRAAKTKRGIIVSWKEKLRSLPQAGRPCVHHMKRRIQHRACTHDYRCGKCDFDQYFNDEFTVNTVVKPVDVMSIKGFRVPQGYYVHPGHMWMKVEEGTTARVGIDEFALRVMGPLDQVEVPLMGKEVRQGSPDIVVSRKGFKAKLLSPVSGVVTAVNNNVREEGAMTNRNPYSDGWVMSVHATDLREDLRNLTLNRETEDFLETEVDRLYDLIEETAGPLATDGGYLGDDIFGNLPDLDWKRLTKLFLKTP